MTKSSYILLLGIAVMILIGAEVWQATGGDGSSLPTTTQVATPIATASSTASGASSTLSATPTTTTSTY